MADLHEHECGECPNIYECACSIPERDPDRGDPIPQCYPCAAAADEARGLTPDRAGGDWARFAFPLVCWKDCTGAHLAPPCSLCGKPAPTDTPHAACMDAEQARSEQP